MMNDLRFNPANPKQLANNMLTNFVSNYDDLGRSSIEQRIRQLNTQDIDYLEKIESRGIINKVARYLNLSNPIEWIFLFLFSIVATSKISKLILNCSISCLL
jgi:hypothetical protein